MYRIVMRPTLFRPPLFFTVFTNDFSGLAAVTSSYEGANRCLVPGVTGFNFFNAMIQ
jgi:hypothetical protein